MRNDKVKPGSDYSTQLHTPEGACRGRWDGRLEGGANTSIPKIEQVWERRPNGQLIVRERGADGVLRVVGWSMPEREEVVVGGEDLKTVPPARWQPSASPEEFRARYGRLPLGFCVVAVEPIPPGEATGAFDRPGVLSEAARSGCWQPAPRPAFLWDVPPSSIRLVSWPELEEDPGRLAREGEGA